MTDHDLIQEARKWRAEWEEMARHALIWRERAGRHEERRYELLERKRRLRRDLRAAVARANQLEKALRRLASQEGFEGAGWVGGDSFAERELRARGRFAEEAIAGVPAEPATEEGSEDPHVFDAASWPKPGKPAAPATEEKPNPDCKFVKMGDHYDCATCGGGRGAPADQWCDSCKARAASSVSAEPATEEKRGVTLPPTIDGRPLDVKWTDAASSVSAGAGQTFVCPNCHEDTFPDVVGTVKCGECGAKIETTDAGAGLPVHLGYDDEEGDRIYFSVGRAAWERAGSPRHLVAGAGQVPADTIEKAREALLAMIKALDRHSAWCGHYKDAPGHSIINSAPKLAREALDALAAVRTPEEQT